MPFFNSASADKAARVLDLHSHIRGRSVLMMRERPAEFIATDYIIELMCLAQVRVRLALCGRRACAYSHV